MNKDDIINILEHGGIVALPTETVYGIFTLKKYTTNVEKIFNIKSRDTSKKLCIYTNNIKYFPEELRQFLPGPLTVIVDGIGYRYSSHSIIRYIIDQVGELLGTSANLSNYWPITHHKHLDLNLDILPHGLCDLGLESTVYSYDLRKIIRPGIIDLGPCEYNKKFLGPKFHYETDGDISIRTLGNDIYSVMNQFWYLVHESKNKTFETTKKDGYLWSLIDNLMLSLK